MGIASGNCAIYSAKIPLLVFFIRTFGSKAWLRRISQFLILAGIIAGLVTLLFAGISCSPDVHEPGPPFLFKCVTALTEATIARGAISLAMDVVMFVMPIPIIVKLQMPLRRKIALGLVFMTGFM